MTDEHEQKKKSAMFLLQLKEKRCLSQVAIDDIVLASKDLFQHRVGRVRAAVHECISRADIDPSDIPGLNENLRIHLKIFIPHTFRKNVLLKALDV